MSDEQRPTEVMASTPAALRRESRFTPGAMLADRFRVIALLAKGGMGEVYRAEDLKLGQQVALKFLPERLARDSDRLARLYGEVRLGRQVSHPNVCRVYDVMEWQGHHFISMEYIDGEDLSSLLRRIGKLPHEKALDIARDICSGLAAAHGLGVVHRDLKPANIMIDGRGTARITDFGLAAFAEELVGRDEVAGTPAYMAPEQLSGGEAGPRTDLYAIGLILFEIFTGKRPERGPTQTLSQQTRELDPAVQRVILRCLEEKPESRPPSIHAVIAALPGGDPIQAALDAGETPSPEMVAAAGETGALSPRVALALLACVALFMFINAVVSQKVMLYARVSLPKKPDVLADRARSLVSMAGYAQRPADVAYNFGWNNDFFESERARRQRFDDVRPSPVLFYYRESPRELVPLEDERRVTPYDPPFTLSRMARVEIDAEGRLIRFEVVPPEVVDATAVSPAIDWMPFIRETGVDPGSLRPTTARWRVAVDSDTKVAWDARYREQPDVPVRIEAASYRRRPVSFAVIPPWRKVDRVTFAGAATVTRWGQLAVAIVSFLGVLGALFFARRNMRRSRGDRRGAFRLAMVLFTIVLVARVVRADHVWDIAAESEILTETISDAIVAGVVAWLLYMAIEPYFRRRWPRLLIGWTRLLAGKGRDPMVGRDILIGAAVGCAGTVIMKASLIVPTFFGGPPPIPIRTYFTALTHVRHVIYLVFNVLQLALGISIMLAFVFLLFHILTRSTWATSLSFTALAALANADVTVPGAVIVGLLTFVVFRRFGLLALAASFVFRFILVNAPATLDTSVWFFGRSLFLMALLAGAAAWAFRIALGAQPVLHLALLEEE